MNKIPVWPFPAGSTRLTAQLCLNCERTWFYAFDPETAEVWCLITRTRITTD